MRELSSPPCLPAAGPGYVRRSAAASIGVGLLLPGEPLVTALITNVGTLARLARGWAESNPLPYVAEFLLGLAVLAAAQVMGQLHPRPAATNSKRIPGCLRMCDVNGP